LNLTIYIYCKQSAAKSGKKNFHNKKGLKLKEKNNKRQAEEGLYLMKKDNIIPRIVFFIERLNDYQIIRKGVCFQIFFLNCLNLNFYNLHLSCPFFGPKNGIYITPVIFTKKITLVKILFLL
jgi:hypothetical protein